MLFAIHFKCAGALKHARPVDGPREFVVGILSVGFCVGRHQLRGRSKEMLDIEHTAGLVGPLDQPAHPREVPGLAVGHRGVGRTGDQLTGPLHFREKLQRIFQLPTAATGPADFEIKAVDLLPHRRADHLSDGAGVFASMCQTVDDRVGILTIEGEKLDHVRLIRQPVPLPEVGLVAKRADQAVPETARMHRALNGHVERCFCGPRNVFRTLNLAIHPINRFGNA